MNKTRITRKQLYDLVWSSPKKDVAIKFSTSDIQVRNICKANHIPLPANGHWMKLRFGKPVEIIPLDESINPQEVIEIVEKLKVNRNVICQDSKDLPAADTVTYHVPERLSNPDKLIQEAISELKEREKYNSGDNLIILFNSIKVKASKKLFNRALRFMDALIKIFRKKGYDIEVKNRETYVIIASEKIQISCREKIKRTLVQEGRWQRAKDTPTGLLTFNIDGFHPKQWIDGKKMIEEQIPQILEKLRWEAERLRVWHLEIEENQKIYRAAAKIEQEKIDARQKDFNGFMALLKASERFQKVKQMREYVNSVENNMKSSDGNNVELKKWIEWAKRKIDWYDPLINYPDSNFEEIDKDTLNLSK